ncbi:MAG: proton-conducting transporter membrane subunit, partial [Bacteroidota bacterium]
GLSEGELTLQALAAMPYSTMGLIAILLVFAGLLFKLSAVPFHFWTPDVYEGSAPSVAAFLSVATKAGGLVVLWRIYALYAETWVFLEITVAVVAIFCFILGNSVALWQENNKRLLAYSSIAQTGFLLIGIITGKADVLLFYLWVYLLLSFGAFGLVQGAKAETIQDFSGLGRKIPLFGLALFILMIGLTGLPPTAGFTAKFWLFAALWESYDENFILLILLVVAALSAVVSLFYYLKMPYFAFFRHAESPIRVSREILLPALGIALLVVGLLFGY